MFLDTLVNEWDFQTSLSMEVWNSNENWSTVGTS